MRVPTGVGLVGHPTDNIDLYTYAGTEQELGRDFAVAGKGYGYGSPLYDNATCDIELGAWLRRRHVRSLAGDPGRLVALGARLVRNDGAWRPIFLHTSADIRGYWWRTEHERADFHDKFPLSAVPVNPRLRS